VLLVVPEVPSLESLKPVIQGFGCRLGGGVLSCEALFTEVIVPTQVLVGELHVRGRPPSTVRLDWSEIPPGLYRNAEIDVLQEA